MHAFELFADGIGVLVVCMQPNNVPLISFRKKFDLCFVSSLHFAWNLKHIYSSSFSSFIQNKNPTMVSVHLKFLKVELVFVCAELINT